MTIVLTPLSFDGEWHDAPGADLSEEEHVIWRAEYGHRRYYTPGLLFCIINDNGDWRIESRLSLDWNYPAIAAALHESNLMEAVFPRRCDALEALQTFVDQAMIDSES